MRLKKFTLMLCSGLIAVLAYTTAYADAFGVGKGLPADTYKTEKRLGQCFYEIKNVPTPHSLFTEYAVRSVDGIGICGVSACSDELSGFWINKYIEEIRNDLEKKYKANPEQTTMRDNLFRTESSADENNTLIFKVQDHKDIRTIVLSRFKVEQDKIVIVLTYVFNNTDDAISRLKELDYDSL